MDDYYRSFRKKSPIWVTFILTHAVVQQSNNKTSKVHNLYYGILLYTFTGSVHKPQEQFSDFTENLELDWFDDFSLYSEKTLYEKVCTLTFKVLTFHLFGFYLYTMSSILIQYGYNSET